MGIIDPTNIVAFFTHPLRPKVEGVGSQGLGFGGKAAVGA